MADVTTTKKPRSKAKEVVALFIAAGISAYIIQEFELTITNPGLPPQLQMPLISAVLVVAIFYILVSLKVPKKKTAAATTPAK